MFKEKPPPTGYRTTPTQYAEMPVLRDIIAVSRTRARASCGASRSFANALVTARESPRSRSPNTPEENQYNRHDAISSFTDVAKKDRKRDQPDSDPRYWRQKIDGKINLETSIWALSLTCDPRISVNLGISRGSVGRAVSHSTGVRRPWAGYWLLFKLAPNGQTLTTLHANSRHATLIPRP